MSSAVNEREVIELRGRVAALKEPYLLQLTQFLALSGDEFNGTEVHRQLLEIHRLAREYFNAVDQFVGNSSLLGAHGNQEWVLGFAEDCHAVLEAMVHHFTFVRATCNRFSIPYNQFTPTKTAFAGIQRMVKNHLPDFVPALASALGELAVPTTGFVDVGAPRLGVLAVTEADAAGPASIEFGPHGIARASGLRSADAVRIATTVVSRGEKGFSAPAVPTAADVLVHSGLAQGAAPGWLRRQVTKLTEAPADVAIRVVGSLVAAAIIAGLVYLGWWVPHQPIP